MSIDETKRQYFKDIPIIKFPDYVERNDYYMLTEDISYFLGGIIPASDVESLFEEFRTMCPKKIKHEQQEFIVFQDKGDKKRKKFDHVKESLLEQQRNMKSTPDSIIEVTKDSSRLCFINAERIHQMFLNALMESESELLVSFILLRSILEEKIIKSPYKSSIGIHSDYPSMEQKKEGNVDMVFPPKFKHSKHTTWTIKKKKAKDKQPEKEKSKSSSSSSTSSEKKASTPASSSKSTKKIEKEDNKDESEKSKKQEPKQPNNSEEPPSLGRHGVSSTEDTHQKNPLLHREIVSVPVLSHSLISIGKSVRVLYSIDVSKNDSIVLTISIKEYEEAIKETEKQVRNIIIHDNRIRDFWVFMDYAFGFNYPGGIVGVLSSQYFNSGLCIVLDTNLRPMLDQIRTKISTCIPYSESILKKAVKTPQQLCKLGEENSSDAASTNTANKTIDSLSITTNAIPTDSCPSDLVNNLESSKSNTQPPSDSNLHVNNLKPKTTSEICSESVANQSFSILYDGKIDLNQCDLNTGFPHWEETTSSAPTDDAYSDSHSACFDDDNDDSVFRKRKNIEEESNSSAEEETIPKKAKIVEVEQLEEPHHITVLKRLLQFKLITNEDYQGKLLFFQAVEQYRAGTFSPLQVIINSQLENLNDFSIYENFICPLTKKFIMDPVLAPDGLLYERSELSQWITTFSSVSLLGGCRVTSFINMPLALEEVNKILSQRVEKGVEFVEQIVEQFKIYCADLLSFIDQLLKYDSANKYRRKLLEHKMSIIFHNITTIVDGHDRYFDCGKEILLTETNDTRKIAFSISILEKNPNPDYYLWFADVIYQCCNRSINTLKDVPNLSPKVLNNILTFLIVRKDITVSQFISSVKVEVSPQPDIDKWFQLLLLLCNVETDLLSQK